MKADVVFVFRIDVNHVPALTERVRQVVGEFDTLAVKQGPRKSANGLGPEIGSRWRYVDSQDWYTVVDPPENSGQFTVWAEGTADGEPHTWKGSVAGFNKVFVAGESDQQG